MQQNVEYKILHCNTKVAFPEELTFYFTTDHQIVKFEVHSNRAHGVYILILSHFSPQFFLYVFDFILITWWLT